MQQLSAVLPVRRTGDDISKRAVMQCEVKDPVCGEKKTSAAEELAQRFDAEKRERHEKQFRSTECAAK